MSPMTPTTLTRLDPRYPLLWRDEDTVQFGLESVVRLDVAGVWVEPLLNRLRTGIRLSSFDVVAHGVGAPRGEARRLLATLRPLLVDDAVPAPPFWADGINLADGRGQERLRQSLIDEGLDEADPRSAGAVAVVMVGGAAAALQLAPYLRDDLPHLPIGFEQDAAVVGPLVVPGRTPCLSCRDAHERDRDEAWPRLHAQLVGTTTRVTAARIAHAAALAARILRTPTPSAGLMVRVSPDGRHAWRSVRHHAECPCRELLFRSPPESATETSPPAPLNAPTTPPAFARPA